MSPWSIVYNARKTAERRGGAPVCNRRNRRRQIDLSEIPSSY